MKSTLSIPLRGAIDQSYLAITGQVFAAALLLILCAHISIPLYFTPVPLTMQTFGVMLIAACLGSRKGAMSVCLYLFGGTLGLPFFAGASFGSDLGYLVGFAMQAYFIGWAIERMTQYHSGKIMAILLASCIMQLCLGSLWLSAYVGFANCLTLGFAPFIIGEAIKCMAITSYLRQRPEDSAIGYVKDSHL